MLKLKTSELDAEEFEKRIDEMAVAYNQAPEDMRKALVMQPQAYDQLQSGWRKDQAINLIADQAVVIKVEQGHNEEVSPSEDSEA